MSPVLEAVEHAFHDIAGFVEVGVVVELHFAVFAGRDAGDCVRLAQPIAQMIGVVSTISNDGAALVHVALKALARLRNIRPIARRQPQMNRVSRPIADQVQLRIQTAFGFADAAPVAFVFLTPLAAIRWVLT